MKELAAEKQFANNKQKSMKDANPGPSKPSNVDGNNNGNSENASPDTDVLKRPMGNKRAKQAMAQGRVDAVEKNACLNALDQLWEKKKEDDALKDQRKEVLYDKSYALEKEKIDLEKRRVAAEEVRAEAEQKRAANEEKSLMIKEQELQFKMKQDEERIMTLGIASMALNLQQYYKSLQNEIMDR